MKKYIYSLSTLAFLAPSLAFAQNVNFNFFTNLIIAVKTVVNSVVPLLIGVAVIFFFVEIIKYIRSKDDADKKAKAIKGIFMSLIAIFIMLGFMGIINILNTALGGNVTGQTLNPNQTPLIQI